MPFVKGQSGNPGGRRKGAKNVVTSEIRGLARNLFDREYWRRTKEKLDAGELHPSLEAKLWSYAFGEPSRDDRDSSKVIVNVGFLNPILQEGQDRSVTPRMIDATLDATPKARRSLR